MISSNDMLVKLSNENEETLFKHHAAWFDINSEINSKTKIVPESSEVRLRIRSCTVLAVSIIFREEGTRHRDPLPTRNSSIVFQNNICRSIEDAWCHHGEFVTENASSCYLSSLFPKPSWKWHCPNHQCCPRCRIICHPWYVETNPHFHRAIRPSPCTDIVRTMTEKTPSISICHNNTILGLFTVHRQFTGCSLALCRRLRRRRLAQAFFISIVSLQQPPTYQKSFPNRTTEHNPRTMHTDLVFQKEPPTYGARATDVRTPPSGASDYHSKA